MSPDRPVIVTVDDDALPAIDTVVKKLEAVGFRVGEVLEFTGTVVGSWSDDLDRLRAVAGVLDAEYSEEKYTQDDNAAGS